MNSISNNITQTLQKYVEKITSVISIPTEQPFAKTLSRWTAIPQVFQRHIVSRTLNLLELHEDIIVAILNSLTLPQLIDIQTTCRKFHIITRNILKRFQNDPMILEMILGFPKLSRLDLLFASFQNSRVIDLLRTTHPFNDVRKYSIQDLFDKTSGFSAEIQTFIALKEIHIQQIKADSTAFKNNIQPIIDVCSFIGGLLTALCYSVILFLLTYRSLEKDAKNIVVLNPMNSCRVLTSFMIYAAIGVFFSKRLNCVVGNQQASFYGGLSKGSFEFSLIFIGLSLFTVAGA